jgi:hypothetical protein
MLARTLKKSSKNFRKTLDENAEMKYLSNINLSTTMVTTTQTETGIYQYRQMELDITQMGIHVYILDNKKQRVGVFAATTNETNPDTIFIGWSMCNFSAGDRFDSQRGVEIAYQRSYKCSIAPVPMSMLHRYEAFKFRCKKYFKGHKAIV